MTKEVEKAAGGVWVAVHAYIKASRAASAAGHSMLTVDAVNAALRTYDGAISKLIAAAREEGRAEVAAQEGES